MHSLKVLVIQGPTMEATVTAAGGISTKAPTQHSDPTCGTEVIRFDFYTKQAYWFSMNVVYWHLTDTHSNSWEHRTGRVKIMHPDCGQTQDSF